MASSLPTPSPKPEPEPELKPPKSAPLPWSHQETLALIQAYQDKWYSLKKGQLKAFQWEEVAVTVAARCGFDDPTKTATQCRHKIEKLRKRYRSELTKPYPNSSWQYFDLMDRMERGPINARPIAASAVVVHYPNADVVVGSGSHNSHLNNNSRYATMLYSGSADYRTNNNNNNNNNNNSEGSEESDEEWSGYGVEAARRSKSKSINNIVREDVRSGKRMGMESERVVRACRSEMNGKRKQFYGGNESEEDDDEDEDDLEEEVEEEDEMMVDGGREVAAEIKGFMERFMRMENKKIEMMRETERYRLEMEKKRMEMILDAQRKIVDTIGRAFGTHKKAKVAQET